MNADGTEMTQLTFNSYNDEFPDFSPDGLKIVFDSDRTGRDELFIMSVDGTEQTQLTVQGGGVPRWQPTHNVYLPVIVK